MKDVQNAIYSIIETRGKECYCILCHAIDIAIDHQPNMPKMKFICDEVRMRTGKRTSEAVSRALNRAAKDIWQTMKNLKTAHTTLNLKFVRLSTMSQCLLLNFVRLRVQVQLTLFVFGAKKQQQFMKMFMKHLLKKNNCV